MIQIVLEYYNAGRHDSFVESIKGLLAKLFVNDFYTFLILKFKISCKLPELPLRATAVYRLLVVDGLATTDLDFYFENLHLGY